MTLISQLYNFIYRKKLPAGMFVQITMVADNGRPYSIKTFHVMDNEQITITHNNHEIRLNFSRA